MVEKVIDKKKQEEGYEKICGGVKFPELEELKIPTADELDKEQEAKDGKTEN